ncbi:hypothetical protein B5D80_14345 [Micromonospora wenchangensis]|uniref:Uncharacterized protein n=1 Tax=Micromonospora wenchangensis TaxID=1185415 RepID=A0A246RM16_9ACTN|nr:hypothetical protein B5D80_14345 [Micromonospora wenchangensis]
MGRGGRVSRRPGTVAPALVGAGRRGAAVARRAGAPGRGAGRRVPPGGRRQAVSPGRIRRPGHRRRTRPTRPG